MSTDISLILSKDGSHTLYNPILNETYHSKNGALQESIHVYIEYGLLAFSDQTNVAVLEVGFGTGLNALLTWNKAEELRLKVEYHTLEPFPLSKEITDQLNYPALMHEPMATERFKKIHECAWEEKIVLSEYFTIYKYKATLEEKSLPVNKFDVCYFDAFAPNHQEDVWREENFRKVFDSLVDGGILTTYCAQSNFKRTLKAVGFTVEKLKGPLYKKEMTWGRKLNSK
ncbi:tRNA (5-methylaminomethyl-2-thiouridine)(34)-methyltransferase MnmD [Cytophaga aurantiaca]|uniref:tRNA (5-methylaminomethyl-2-thiouridine)(34)-methyltransferase MnmD n=1 Tax=Cytophaga aurantiaca TaxID=29530 RepID=UPI00038132F1|nr:tRNA (5-methylaminomethyl-2-thiouridine)(34)-methyltransferase MnmD [Cytophaga aurantiaca]